MIMTIVIITAMKIVNNILCFISHNYYYETYRVFYIVFD